MFSTAGHLKIEHHHNVVIVTFLDAELRSGLVETLRSSLLALVDEGHRRIILNLEHVTFLESSALGLIVQLGTKLSHVGGRLQLCGARPDVRRLFTGPPLLPFNFPLFADAAAAMSAAHGTA